MDFIPAGFITFNTAIDRILRATHGDGWNKREIRLEEEEITIQGAVDENGQPMKGRPFDRMIVAEGQHQIREAEEALLTTLLEAKLSAEVEDGSLVPQEYWNTSGAITTLRSGILNLGDGAKPEDMKWQNHRVLLKKEKFDAWLDCTPRVGAETRGRKRDIKNDALVKSKIEQVMAVARRLWPGGKDFPGQNQAARLLIIEGPIKEIGYSVETLRKILSGTYPTSKRLGISGFPGTDTR